MRAEKMRGIDATDLQRQEQEAQEQLFRFRFQMGMGQAEGLKKYRSLKKDRARMLTVLHEKAGKGEVPAVAAPVKQVAVVKQSRWKFGRNKQSK
jgi:large subunit ribosomal protein L29